jgi:endoribonuclease Dicer
MQLLITLNIDSVLKFITSTQVFVNYPKSREDELTELRGRMISNKALFRSAKELKLYQYIYSQNIPHRIWRPPNFTSPSDSAENIKRLTTHKLGDKTLADVIESTLGATYCSAGLQASLHTARQLRVPLHQQVHQMSDFHSVYQEQRQSQSIASQYDPSLRELDVRRVSEIVGYEFDDPSLIVEALTHASYVDSSVPCYQRLEFLGDAVLDFCVTKYLHDKYKTAQPSTLHSLKKSSVNNNILSVLCVQLQLHHHIRHVSSSLVSAVEGFNNSIKIIQEEGKDQGEYWLNLGPPKVLSDVIESVIGAVYVDSKFDVRQAEILFDRWLRPLLDKHISIELIQVHPFEKLQCLVKELGCSKYELK